MSRRSALFVALLSLSGCGKDEAKAGSNAPPGSGTVAAAPATVDLFVDDKLVAHLGVKDLASYPRLDGLLPVAARRMGQWDDLALQGRSAKPTQIHRPGDMYRELVPALFVGDDGAPSFGMFDPVELAKKGKPGLREDGLREVRIKLEKDSGRGKNEQGEGGGVDPTKLEIAIQTPKGKSVLSGAKVLEIPRQPMPGDPSREGWPLSALLDAAGITKPESLSLTDASGTNLRLDKDDLDPAKTIPFIRLNHQGTLRVYVLRKRGDGWERGGDLKGLVSIQQLR